MKSCNNIRHLIGKKYKMEIKKKQTLKTFYYTACMVRLHRNHFEDKQKCIKIVRYII